MDNFITVYEISKGFDRSLGIGSIVGIILLIIGIIGMVIKKRSHGYWPIWIGPPLLGVVVGGIIVILSVIFFIGSLTVDKSWRLMLLFTHKHILKQYPMVGF